MIREVEQLQRIAKALLGVALRNSSFQMSGPQTQKAILPACSVSAPLEDTTTHSLLGDSTNTSTYMHACTRMHTHTYIHRYTRMYTYAHVHRHTFAHVCTLTHMHTHMHSSYIPSWLLHLPSSCQQPGLLQLLKAKMISTPGPIEMCL